MPVNWPLTLQQKLLEAGFSHQFGETAIETEMDVGEPKKRNRYTKAIDTFTATIHLDIDEYNTLYGFYRTTLNGGVDTFLFDHPITGVESEFQFINPPSMAPLGGRIFTVTMNWRLV